MWPSPALRGLFASLTSLAVLAACSDDGTTPAPENGNGPGGGGGGGSGSPPSHFEILATGDLTFLGNLGPGGAAIPRDGTITWINDSNLQHTVTPRGHDAFERAETHGRGEIILEHTFTTPGMYEFYCEFHVDSGMEGVVHVTE